MNNESLYDEIISAVHKALDMEANDYIAEAVSNFEHELRKRKNEIFIKILDEIEISSVFNPAGLSQDVHIVFKHR